MCTDCIPASQLTRGDKGWTGGAWLLTNWKEERDKERHVLIKDILVIYYLKH